ncbi:MAG TPA: RNA-binding S4 domain-containing protein [Steroidobacteraceae bacterium]|nr:RNA-binding S4 domain-containing protein [Steroidobacteraceae bacterium]
MAHPPENELSEGSEGGGLSLRIDRWLWCTRLFKSRSQAAEAVGGGKVHINGRRVKPAHGVRVGDRVAITRAGFEFECEVRQLPERRGSAPIAQACYLETDQARAAREKYSEQARLAAAFAPRGDERPDKHARRELRRLRGRD